jgi:hypothetical protein
MLREVENRKKLEKLWKCYEETCFTEHGLPNELFFGEALAFLLRKTSNEVHPLKDIQKRIEDELEEYHPLYLLDEILNSVENELNKMDFKAFTIDDVLDIITDSDEIQEFLEEWTDNCDDERRFLFHIGLFFKIEDLEALFAQFLLNKNRD